MSKSVLFSGQGAQKVGMGKSLYENSSIAKEIYDRANDVLGWDLKTLCFEGPEDALTETKVCQPALFVMGYAVFKTLDNKGLTADLSHAIGLSLGELTALAAAEAFSFEDGLKVVAERGRLMQEACDATDGAMASLIGGSRESVERICEARDVDMANLNCPGQIVISGDSEKIKSAIVAAKESGDFKMVVPLKVAGAYHSRLMESARQEFAKYLKDVEINSPKLKVLSNTTGNSVSSPDEIREALGKQVVSSVLWEDCMRNVAADGVSEFYECGPGGVLAGMAKRTDRSWKVHSLAEFDSIQSL